MKRRVDEACLVAFKLRKNKEKKTRIQKLRRIDK